MNMLKRTVLFAVACALGSAATAQQYPTKPVRMIVGIAPGGGLDTSARLVASKLSDVLGQQVFVENRAGAGGTIAAAAVASAPPDGYTLQYAASSLLIAPSIYKKLAFHPVTSFTAVGAVGWESLVVAVNPSVQARTTAELIALLKANPGKFSYGSPGVGSIHHLTMELFRTQAGVNIVHVPYKGAALYLPDVMTGVLPMAIMSVTAAVPHVKAGKLRVIATSRPFKVSIAPDWPSIADTLPGFDASPSFFIVAPAGTPGDVVGRLSGALKMALSREDVMRAFEAAGGAVEYMGPEALAVRIRADVSKWDAIARESGARLE